MATVYQAQGKYGEAEPLFKRALAIREKALGPEHPSVAQSLENYAALLRKTGRGTEAANMETRAKAIRAYGPSLSRPRQLVGASNCRRQRRGRKTGLEPG
ncbi:MAG: tetratricopeptide repeat protein [Nitrospinota bacterium]